MLVTMSVTPSKNVSLNISHTHQKFTMLVTPYKNNSHNVSHTLQKSKSQCQYQPQKLLVTKLVTLSENVSHNVSHTFYEC